MAMPGWYPDPAGGGGLRWWDGSAWTNQTSGSSPDQADEPPRRTGPWLVLLAVVLVVALLAWFFVRRDGGGAVEDHNSSTPTISAWNEQSSSPEPSASEEPTDNGGRPVACPKVETRAAAGQPSQGRYAGGGLSYAEVPGWKNSQGWGVDWASDTAGQSNHVARDWASIAMVGEVDTAHFPNPRAAARMLASCEATSFYYHGISGRRDTLNQAVTVDGRPGWHLRTEITVDGHSAPGDQLDVVVVDVGRPGRLGVFVSEAPLGDQARIDLVTAARESLRVEG